MNRFVAAVLLLVFAVVVPEINGHGMMLDPPGRSSRWRYDSSAPPNYDDMGLYCGGISNQWNTHGGKCGLCGDDYGLPTPRPNELGGYYGSGVIVKTYSSSTAKIGVQITANHFGYIYFNLCNLDQYGRESEECFERNRLRFVDGSDKYYIGSTLGWIDTTVVFPQGLKCNHCVLRWTYYAGNNWGICEDGSQGNGCGPQESFKSCADIRITASRNVDVETPAEVPNDQA